MAVLGNFWRKFLDLLPSEPRLVGTIISIDSPGDYSIQLAGGGVVQALGDSGLSVSNKVFVVGKKIEGRAPDLPAVTIEV